MIEDKSLLKIDELYEKYNLECSRKAIFNEISKDKDKRKSFFYRNRVYISIASKRSNHCRYAVMLYQ